MCTVREHDANVFASQNAVWSDFALWARNYPLMKNKGYEPRALCDFILTVIGVFLIMPQTIKSVFEHSNKKSLKARAGA